MPRRCTVCSHPERKGIDEALFRNNSPLRNVSKQFGVTASALFRHKQHSPIAGSVREVTKELEKLPLKKAAYVRGRIDGKSKKQAALDAGFSETMAEHAADKIETKDVKQVFARVIRAIIPPEFIAKAIAEGMQATETKFFAHEGVVQDEREVPNWPERRQYLELAAEYGGYHTGGEDGQGQRSGVILILPGQPQIGKEPSQATDIVIEADVADREEILSLPDKEEEDE
jgi:hypothetical protein